MKLFSLLLSTLPMASTTTTTPLSESAAAGSEASTIRTFGVLLFPGFQILDVFGPIDVLNSLAMKTTLNLSVLSRTLDPVSNDSPTGVNPFNSSFTQSILPTHTFDQISDLDVLLVPGGVGTRASDLAAEINFIARVFPNLKYLITICTGSALAARAQVLNGHKATSNKASFPWVASQGPDVYWVAKARWVESGKVWSSSGVSAGIDAVVAWVASVYGESVAEDIVRRLEYRRVEDSGDDPFAEVYGRVDIPPVSAKKDGE